MKIRKTLQRHAGHEVQNETALQSLKLLTPDDVSNLVGVERVTILRLARAGRIPSIKIGKAVRFRPASIERWMAEQESAR